jgi:hypothetical protein
MLKDLSNIYWFTLIFLPAPASDYIFTGFFHTNVVQNEPGDDKCQTSIGLVALLLLLRYGFFSTQQDLAPGERLQTNKSRVFSNGESLDALRRMASKLKTSIVPTCDTELFGNGWGGHVLCNYQPDVPCHFCSFGIADDYSFDTDVANKRSCQGFAADPTVNRSSILHPKIIFHYVTAKTRLEQNFHIVTSIPSLRNWLGHWLN